MAIRTFAVCLALAASCALLSASASPHAPAGTGAAPAVSEPQSAFPANTAGAALYVSPNGSDSNSGGPNEPFRTIERAAKAARPGTTVLVAPGLYTGTIQTRTAGTASAAIRYQSAVKWAARLQGTGNDAVWTNHGDYVDIVGFDVSGSGRIGILNLASHTRIAGNHVHHLALIGGCTGDGGAGIDNGNYAASDGDIVDNIVHDIGTPGACNGVHGIYSSNRGGRIANNMVYRASSFGIHLWHAATRVIVANNTVFANGSATMGGGIVLGNGDSPGKPMLNHTKVVNNIVYDNPGVSIKEFCYTGHDCTGADNIFLNNLVFKNGAPMSLRRGRARNTISADPAFENYRQDGSGNYRLSAQSPARGKGADLPLAGRANTLSQMAATGSPNVGADICQVPATADVGRVAKSNPIP